MIHAPPSLTYTGEIVPIVPVSASGIGPQRNRRLYANPSQNREPWFAQGLNALCAMVVAIENGARLISVYHFTSDMTLYGAEFLAEPFFRACQRCGFFVIEKAISERESENALDGEISPNTRRPIRASDR